MGLNQARSGHLTTGRELGMARFLVCLFFFLFSKEKILVNGLHVDLVTEFYDAAYLPSSSTSSSSKANSLTSFFSSPVTTTTTPDQRSLSLSLSTDRLSQINDPVFQSPSNGTDILFRPIHLIRCKNQTLCIQPKLQLQRQYSVYYCKRVSYGVRFYYLIREGLLLHPNLNLVDTPAAADIIIYLPESAAWDKSECNLPEYASKLVVLDESDGSHIMERSSPSPWNLMYFKRSYIHRHNGIFKGYMGYVTQQSKIFPMTYPLGEAYVRPSFPLMEERDLEIVCTLRENHGDQARGRVKTWVNEYAKIAGLNVKAGEINHASRTTVDTAYFNQMYRAKIIVTVNPAGWEGDFRFMEAMASGALVFVDHMHTPRQYPLQHGLHVIYFDNNNKTDLFAKLDHYRQEVRKSRSIAISGYLHAMKFHRSASLLDYIFRTIHVSEIRKSNPDKGIEQQEEIPYTETGFDLREIAVRRQQRFKETSQVPLGIR